MRFLDIVVSVQLVSCYPAVFADADAAGNEKKHNGQIEVSLPNVNEVFTDSTEATSVLNLAKSALSEKESEWEGAFELISNARTKHASCFVKTGERRFLPIKGALDQLLKDLTADQMKHYRMIYDTQVEEFLGEAVTSIRSEEKLLKVVDSFFHTSHGDDAALLLASIYLDRGNYTGAVSLLRKLLTDYRGMSVPREEVMKRLALAETRARFFTSAKSRISKLSNQKNRDLLNKEWARCFAESQQRGEEAIDYSTFVKANGWTADWVERFSFSLGSTESSLTRALVRMNKGDKVAGLKSRSPSKTKKLWLKHSWLPVNQVAVEGRKAVIKHMDGLMCLHPVSGRLLWEYEGSRSWNSISAYTLAFNETLRNNPEHLPATREEIYYFGDQLGQSVSIHGDYIYHVIGNEHISLRDRFTRAIAFNGGGNLNSGNRLLIHSLRTGKLIGGIGKIKDTGAVIRGRGWQPGQMVEFLALPQPVEGRGVVAPCIVDQQLRFWVIDPRRVEVRKIIDTGIRTTGEEDESRWKQLAFKVHDDALYFTTGTGVVAKLNLVSEEMEWVQLYERHVSPKKDRVLQEIYGWQRNEVFLKSGQLVVFPADAPRVLFFDALTGRPVRSIPVKSPSHVVAGIDQNTWVWVADQSLVKMQCAEGKELWRRKLPRITGYATLVGNHAVVPAGDQMCIVNLRDGMMSSQSTVRGLGGTALGSLVSDGEYLISSSMNRYMALRPQMPVAPKVQKPQENQLNE